MSNKYLNRIFTLSELGIVSEEDYEIIKYYNSYKKILNDSTEYNLENGNIVYLNHDENSFLIEILSKESKLEYCSKIFQVYPDLILSHLLDIEFCYDINMDNSELYDYIIENILN